MRKCFRILVAVLVVTGVCGVLGCVGGGPVGVIEGVKEALRAVNLEKAKYYFYDGEIFEEFMDEMGRETFKDFKSEIVIIRPNKKVEGAGKLQCRDVDGTIHLEYRDQSGSGPFTFTLVLKNGEWKIYEWQAFMLEETGRE